MSENVGLHFSTVVFLHCILVEVFSIVCWPVFLPVVLLKVRRSDRFLPSRDKVGELLSRVSSLRLHAQYAKAREADGHYHEAARAYESARDCDNAARVYLDLLKSPDDAVRIVRESGSVEGAKMVARYFSNVIIQ